MILMLSVIRYNFVFSSFFIHLGSKARLVLHIYCEIRKMWSGCLTDNIPFVYDKIVRAIAPENMIDLKSQFILSD